MIFYNMVRIEDETGNSGTGVVGEVAVFGDGTAILHWCKDTNVLKVTSTVIYATTDDLLLVHGHGGKTVLEEVWNGEGC